MTPPDDPPIVTADELAKGVHFDQTGQEQQAEHLRQLIVAKNADYFNYWRHENDTYTLGYRKHEQGKNVWSFRSLIKLAEEKDKEIATRVPRAVTYRIERQVAGEAVCRAIDRFPCDPANTATWFHSNEDFKPHLSEN